jgi:predicted PurR-regulated permease PerM
VVKEQVAPRPAAPTPALTSAAGDARPVTALSVPLAHPQAAAQPAPGSRPEEPGPQPPAPSNRWREPTKYVVVVGLFLATLAILWISRSVISTVIVAALLAMIVQPVIGFFQRRLKLSHGLSIAITYLMIVALIVLIPLFVIPNLIQTLNDLINIDFHALAETISSTLEDVSAQVSQIPVLNGLLTPLLDSMTAALQGIPPPGVSGPVTYEETMGGIVDQLVGTLGFIANILGPIISAVVTVVFMLLISFHPSLSGRRMLGGYPRLIPPAYLQEITDLASRIEGVWLSFLRGQFALMAIVGVIVWLGNALLGNRNALLLGFISGMMEIIPNLGPALALIPGVGMAPPFLGPAISPYLRPLLPSLF